MAYNSRERLAPISFHIHVERIAEQFNGPCFHTTFRKVRVSSSKPAACPANASFNPYMQMKACHEVMSILRIRGIAKNETGHSHKYRSR